MTARTIRYAKLSMLLNAVLAIGKIGVGVYSLSIFVCVNGFYNVGIALAKHTAVKGHSESEQRGHYARVGWIILVTSAVYMVYCANMAIRGRANVTYDMITSLAISTFSFAEIGAAIYGVAAARKMKSLAISAAKRVSLVTALISLVLTQSALLGLTETENVVQYCGWTGLIVGGVSAIIGLSMIVRMRREVREDKLCG
jgi:divalent metal cation (Fe/Co/Zn/Cd) transporter